MNYSSFCTLTIWRNSTNNFRKVSLGPIVQEALFSFTSENNIIDNVG